jgi:hypothetical protein
MPITMASPAFLLEATNNSNAPPQFDTRFRGGESSALCGESGALVLSIWNAECKCEKGGAKRFHGDCPAWRQREAGAQGGCVAKFTN